jgi:hypothetical protein
MVACGISQLLPPLLPSYKYACSAACESISSIKLAEESMASKNLLAFALLLAAAFLVSSTAEQTRKLADLF